MSYPAIPSYGCPHCGEKFFTPFSLAAHKAQAHYRAPGEREETVGRIKRNADLAKQSRIRNETPDWTER